ncbi:MAG: hypothetical protein KC493_08890 [Bacteriovoracaceae bacterium]|nr:hypothetical protein [Bacteriovoracaceae bacterium]
MSEEAKEKQENPLINIGLNVVIPAVIMTKFSKPEYLGPVWGLVTALSFPLGYGLWDYIKKGKMNFFSILGLISVLLTGGIGLLKLNKTWMIVKETAIPALMGIGVFVSAAMGKPLIKLFLNQIMDIPKVDEAFKNKGHDQLFEKNMSLCNHFLAGTFFLSALLNFVLAVYVLQGEPGSTEFNESLGNSGAEQHQEDNQSPPGKTASE